LREYTIKFFALILLLITSTLSAIDLEIKVGTGLFYTGAQGYIEYTDVGFTGSYSQIDLKNSGQFYFWSDIKTQIDYLPIFRFQYLKIHTGGDSKLHLEGTDMPTEFQDIIDIFNDQNWESGLSQNIYDLYLYYEFFEEKKHPSFGIGGGLKIFDYGYNVELILPLQVGDRGGKTVPMLFLTTRYEIPSVQLGFEIESEVYIFGTSTLYDARAKMDLLIELDENTKAGFEIGYRDSYYDLRGDDSYKANMHYQGIYVGVMTTFE